MKSRRLIGFHGLIFGHRVEVYAGNDWQYVAHFQANKEPILKYRSEFILTLSKRVAESDHSHAGWNPPNKGTFGKLIENSLSHRVVDVFGQWQLHYRISS